MWNIALDIILVWCVWDLDVVSGSVNGFSVFIFTDGMNQRLFLFIYCIVYY